MWRLVREGLRFYLPVLLAAWVTSTVGIVVVFAVLTLVGVIDVRSALSWIAVPWPLTLLIASAVAGWISLGTDMGEHRLRMHMTLPIPIDRVALAQLLLPAALLLLGVPLAHAAGVVAGTIYHSHTPWLGHSRLALATAHLLFLHQLALATREVTVLRERGWWQPAAGSLFLIVMGALTFLGLPMASLALRTVTVVGLTVALMGFTVTLFRRRMQFTR